MSMLQVQIFIDKDELKGGKELWRYILELLMEQGIVGATVFHGEAGFGRHHRLKQPGRLFSFDEIPLLIVFIDEVAKVKAALTELRMHYRGGFVATFPVEQW